MALTKTNMNSTISIWCQANQLFKKKVESLLEKLISELNIEQSSFLEAMEIGINSPEKRYFMQLIACDNYDYFKSMMTKRNLQLEESAYK